MDSRVYAPPSRPAEQRARRRSGAPRPAYELFSVGQIWCAIVFGGVVSGVLLTALNYRRLGHNALALTAYLWGLTALIVDVASVLRMGMPGLVAPFLMTALWFQAQRDSGLFDDHAAAGGARASNLLVLALTAIGVVTRIALAFV